MAKQKPRKTEKCEWCNKAHYSENARLRCMKAKEKETCECDRYWTTRWLSHQPKCSLNGTLRDEVIPYTAEELAAKEAAKSRKPKQVRRAT